MKLKENAIKAIIIGSLALVTLSVSAAPVAATDSRTSGYRNPYPQLQKNPYAHLHRDPYTHSKLPPPSPDLRETYNLPPSIHLNFDTVHDNPIMEEKGFNDQARFWRRKQNMRNRIASLAEDDKEEESSAAWRRFHTMNTMGITADSREQSSQAAIPSWRRIHQLDKIMEYTNSQTNKPGKESSFWRNYQLARQHTTTQSNNSQSITSQERYSQQVGARATTLTKAHDSQSISSQKQHSQKRNTAVNNDRSRCRDSSGNIFQQQCLTH
jgi:hypothetical protein